MWTFDSRPYYCLRRSQKMSSSVADCCSSDPMGRIYIYHCLDQSAAANDLYLQGEG